MLFLFKANLVRCICQWRVHTSFFTNVTLTSIYLCMGTLYTHHRSGKLNVLWKAFVFSRWHGRVNNHKIDWNWSALTLVMWFYFHHSAQWLNFISNIQHSDWIYACVLERMDMQLIVNRCVGWLKGSVNKKGTFSFVLYLFHYLQ